MNSLVLFVNREDVLQAVFVVYTTASRRACAQTFAGIVGCSEGEARSGDSHATLR